MKNSRRFSARDSVADLVMADYNILPVLSRFNIPLGFGNKTIEQVCNESEIDLNLFLLIVNFVLTDELDRSRSMTISPANVVDFLHNSHEYFLAYKIPHIRNNLTTALDADHNDINPMIVSFFDDFVTQLSDHFNYEEKTVFPYIKALANGEKTDYTIEEFRRHHEEVTERLAELKNLILRYYITSTPNRMYDVLVDIYNCEEDLESHSIIENTVLIPLVGRLEEDKR